MARGRRTTASGYRLTQIGERGPPLRPEQDYLSVWLVAVNTPSGFFSTSKYAPVVWAALKHFTFDGEQTLCGLFPNTSEERPDFGGASTAHVVNLQLTPRLIAREQVTIDFTLGQIRKKDYLAGALNVASEIAASPAAAFFSAAAPIAGAVSMGVQTVDRIKQSLDALLDADKLRALGAINTTLTSPIATGRYVLMDASVDTKGLRFDEGGYALRNADGPIKAPYLVLDFVGEETRPDWMTLPDLNQAWRRIREAALAQQDVAGAVDYFRVTAVTSPDLTRADAQRLVEAAERKFSSVMAQTESFTTMEDPGDMAESLELMMTSPAAAAESFTLPAGLSGRMGSMGVSEGVFARALELVLEHEGGYVNHPKDPGRATNRGVTQATYDAYRKKKKAAIRSVKDITPDEIAEIYRQGYWVPARCQDMPGEAIAIAVFDAAVNHGVQPAIRMLQQCVGTPDLAVDGLWGESTQKRVLSAGSDMPGLVQAFLDRRETFYRRLVEMNPSQGVFLRGWLKRVSSLRSTLQALLEGGAPAASAADADWVPLQAAAPDFSRWSPPTAAPAAAV
ncbi:hypothetical protein GC169_05270 [bacterium]|nr:hypothetical protein [bacterium]